MTEQFRERFDSAKEKSILVPMNIRTVKSIIRDALIKGRHLRQERTAHANEINAVEELIAEGSARATDWREDGVRVVRRASDAFDE